MPVHQSDKSPDELDLKILEFMLSGFSNRDIANEVKKPLSTIQRRTRQLLESELIKPRYELNYKKFGYKKGLLHIYLHDGNAQEIAEKVSSIKNILSASIHIGNSDVVAEYVCSDSGELLALMALLKKLPAVQRVVWSEEVFFMPAHKPLIPNFDMRERQVK